MGGLRLFLFKVRMITHEGDDHIIAIGGFTVLAAANCQRYHQTVWIDATRCALLWPELLNLLALQGQTSPPHNVRPMSVGGRRNDAVMTVGCNFYTSPSSRGNLVVNALISQ